MTQTIPEWTLGWRLQRSLAHAGIGIDEMAADLGVSRSTVSRWVNDHSDPRVGFLKLWALRTGVPLEWLVSGGSMFDKTSPSHGLAGLHRITRAAAGAHSPLPARPPGQLPDHSLAVAA